MALCLLRAFLGLSGVQAYSHDAFGMLDGAWRIQNGQTPHADFYTPLGPAIYLLTSLGLRISNGGAEGLGYSQALAGLVLAVWIYLLSRGRLRDWSCILMCLTVLFLSLSPVSVGEPPTRISCMPYNRYGYALMALLLLEAVKEGNEFKGGLSTGAALALALFLKISYFVGGVFLFAGLLPCRKQSWERWAGLLAGSGIVSLAFCAYLRFNLIPMWNDLQMAAAARQVKLNWWIVENLRFPVAFFVLFVALSAALLWSLGQAGRARSVGIAAAATCIVGIFLLATNFQYYDLPLNALVVILILDALAGKAAPDDSRFRRQAWLLAAGSLFVLWSISYDVMSLGFGLEEKLSWKQVPHTSFDAPVLAGFRSYESGYVSFVNDGLALVRQHRRSGDTVMSLDFSNPFSYALAMKPAPGGATALHYGVNFTQAVHPLGERLFGEASLVAQAKQPSEPRLAIGIPLVYGAYLQAHFHLIGESRDWLLYRRSE